MADIGILILRVVLGLYVAAHGAQKLVGWFGGPGLRATTQTFGGKLGLRPAWLWATVLSAAEMVGGLMTTLGILGPLGPTAVAAAMLGAVVFVHWPLGPWTSKGGYELPATNLGMAASIALIGFGRFSVDVYVGIVLSPLVREVFGVLSLLGVVAAGPEPSRLPGWERSLRRCLGLRTWSIGVKP